ncbi:hypothetical protein ACHAWU_002977 [Discostella pseudostelligera]|uniref:Legume lectin domain-containing protein n=1 Tax=Discostella pseudostelligera TaxID=259834 RepID=A0ABD3M0A0_9STRA
MKQVIPATILLAQFHVSLSDFLYADFNKTTGLVFNGAASPTACEGSSNVVLESNSSSTNNDNGKQSRLYQYGHTATTDVFSTVETTIPQNNSSNDDDIAVRYAVFGHRLEFDIDAAITTTEGCNSKLRLTPSHPSKAGSVWYDSRVPVLTGFETVFSWQISDQSVECTEHVDRYFSRDLHRSCAVHGGDGFAFVIHGDPVGASALGGDGEHLGYGGISNSLAVEFDTWTNVDTQQSDDVFQDHISIHSSGPTLPNSSNETTSLGYWRTYNIADGKVHSAKVQYLPFIETRYFELMTANENLIPYLKDNGEGRRLGTLAVFVDQGIVEDRPLFAIPVNLSLLLNLPDSLAYVGFTASTGRKWQKNDIHRWEWCNSERCKGKGGSR